MMLVSGNCSKERRSIVISDSFTLYEIDNTRSVQHRRRPKFRYHIDKAEIVSAIHLHYAFKYKGQACQSVAPRS